MTTIHDLARTAYQSFETRSRSDGDDYVCCKEGTPEWVRDLIHAAHDDMLPDDYRYEFVRDACEMISESTATNDDPTDLIDSYISVYTSELLNWLSSSVRRKAFVNTAVDDHGWSDLDDAMKQGMYAERLEVYDTVYAHLEELAEKMNQAQDGDS